MSGLGKGITLASVGKILQSKGFSVTAIKIDPYLNVDAGTLRPTEHGEVWVTEDGGEIDQDLGHYERFLDVTLSKEHNITTGQVYGAVIQKERQGKYLGKTVEVIPHVTDEIKERIRQIARKTGADFVLIEIGGTVGEYQSEIYYRAARFMKSEGEKVLFVHVAYVPIPKHLGEMKTKPAQQSVEMLGRLGIQPDFVVGRAEVELDGVRKEKIALYCNVSKEDIISNPDLENPYELPLVFERQDFGNKILRKLGIQPRPSDLQCWTKLVESMKNASKRVGIGIVGKYFATGSFSLPDAYVSVIEALKHAAAACGAKLELYWIDAQRVEQDRSSLEQLDGIVVPGGFGSAGVEGKIAAIRYARERGIPYLGLCFGLQLAVVEFARHACGLSNAHSTEIDPNTAHPVVDLLPWQREVLSKGQYGATMRLGSHPVTIKEGTLAYRLYQQNLVKERFRHRYEVNPEYVPLLEEHGLIVSGKSALEDVVQIIELADHPFFLATQFHPEFTSRPLRPHPLFLGFMKACLELSARNRN